ncbi:PLP-dependent aminotransferase family protein [Clostridium botulinum]|uniref:Transcriptional regulator, GntR family/aminotransferase, classes I and II n=1 Tax=Clostridium botulinum (strain Okra / Type B1) TaxID=498213 RepID=B1IGS9_CLOBK|nr:PLP-dependent aminotransferase family protein [Clostridium botulinum]EKX79817.1 GntR family transcriptional regulator [Clostridium botulinum CFSAN001628]ACA45297.1 transcriptional regulator, GntR family/aminotransferase, classes I and II [Clostridium botulinum B1 str. Okra]MBD5564001.1 PLP-dependent aminotransferase family protein [Clostridium botulinum]MBD5566628.1 PLP-dependent aminotransferase family protein [Clostridium botulinum]MBD5568856.1 PLP-dependent aminotransferase family protei
MNIKIDKNSLITITQQLVHYFSDRIMSGFIKAGQKLPSIRSLAKELGISPMTIIKAYNNLEQNGLVTTIQGKGTYVNERNSTVKSNNITEKDSFQWQMSVPDYLSRSQFRYNPNLSYSNDYYNLSVASLNHKLLPTKTILKDSLGLIQNDIKLLSEYPPVQGDYEFRNIMSQYLRSKEIATSPENILVTSGSQQGISLIASTFIGPGDIVVMETPTYPGAIDLFKCRGAVILTVPVDSEGMRTDILMNLCDKHSPKLIYTIPNFHNPTGYSMSSKRKAELLDIARYNDILIVEDDPWNEISYKKEKIKSIKSMDTDGHVVYIKSLSKILGPSYRLAVIISESSILSRLIAAKANHDLGTSVLIQKTIINFIQSNKITYYIESLNKQLVKRRDKVISLLKSHAPSGMKWAIPEGGINIWVTLPKNFNVEKLLSYSITTKNISFLPGTICYPNEVEFNNLRICFTYLDEEFIEDTIIELCNLIKLLYTTKNITDYRPII